jgi:Ser/Thr protein kinase RdoA (MazF antagonist)
MTQHIPIAVNDMLCSHWDICDIAQTNLVWTGLDNQNSIIETEDASFFVQVSDTPFQPTLIDKKTRMLRWLTDQGMTEVVPAMPTRDGMLFVEDEAVGCYLALSLTLTAIYIPNGCRS